MIIHDYTYIYYIDYVSSHVSSKSNNTFDHLCTYVLRRCRPNARPSAPEILTGREPSGRARKDCESRIEISGETSYCYNFASLLILFFYYFVRRATRRKTTGRGRRRILFATTGTTFTTSDSRAEIAPEEQDRAESRVEFAPRKEEEQRKTKRLSKTGIARPDRRYPPRTEDEQSV